MHNPFSSWRQGFEPRPTDDVDNMRGDVRVDRWTSGDLPPLHILFVILLAWGLQEGLVIERMVWVDGDGLTYTGSGLGGGSGDKPWWGEGNNRVESRSMTPVPPRLEAGNVVFFFFQIPPKK